MASSASLQWQNHELPEDCYTRCLTTLDGNPALETLPVEQNRTEIENALDLNRIVVVKAGTGSGKTTKVPEFMYRLLNAGVQQKWPILIVQLTNLACDELVSTLVETFGWKRRQIHLRTGNFDGNKIEPGKTVFSVTTYGMLWKWLTGSECQHKHSAAGHDIIG
eukprot:12421367-Karenia_brevis.AAC.1